MKLKLNFISKTPKQAGKNELIFVNNKNFKHKILSQNELIENELFKEKKIIQINHNLVNFIFINSEILSFNVTNLYNLPKYFDAPVPIILFLVISSINVLKFLGVI